MDNVILIPSISWEYKIINGDIYFVQAYIIENDTKKVFVQRMMSKEEFQLLFKKP